MKKLLMAIMAMFVMVSCSNKYDKMAALYENAAAEVEAAETRGQLTDINDQLKKDAEALLKEYEEEFAEDIKVLFDENADEDLKKELEAEGEKVEEAEKAYEKAVRVKEAQLRD